MIKEEPLHNSTYKGKPAVINRNTTVPPAETESQTPPETQPQATEVQENSEIGPGGGGSETIVPDTDIPVVPAAE